ncbi:hypothetical protein QBC39DRAFT_266719 [Podospora conica]|nr:hypothetical protein QBC39DRAFT_266719 [Schizothecium conicum]
MDILPVELIHLIFEHCDPDTTKTLRLVASRLADVGYEYLLPQHFNAVEWKDDVQRLHSVATHPRLQRSIHSLTLNFARMDEYNARHASYTQQWAQEPEERKAILQDAWMRYYDLEERASTIPAFHTRPGMVDEAFKGLTNLHQLEVTYDKCPYDIAVFDEVFRVRDCRKLDRAEARQNINVLLSALRHTRLSSLSFDRLPLELFKVAEDRRHWFNCAPAFESLSKLDLVLDSPLGLLPHAQKRAINGLGHVLQFAPNLTHLSLAVQAYNSPNQKFGLSFRALLGSSFRFPKLTDLKLEGITCAEDDLRAFLIRHGPTLERLRLGGRGLANHGELSTGGVHLYQGTFRSLLSSLRGHLPRLQRFHMEGDMQAGEVMTNTRELYKFHAVTDDNWMEVASSEQGRWCPAAGGLMKRMKTIDSAALEKFLVEGGPYPKLAKAEVDMMIG